MADDQTSVQDALGQLDVAFAQHDLAAILDLCTEDVVFIGSGEGEEAVGRSGIEAMFAAIADRADGTEFVLMWESVSADIIGDLAILSAVGEATLHSPHRKAVCGDMCPVPVRRGTEGCFFLEKGPVNSRPPASPSS